MKDSFRYFKTIVNGEDHYVLGAENALAVDLIEFLAYSPSMLQEYILHEAMERTRMEHYSVVDFTTEYFGSVVQLAES